MLSIRMLIILLLQTWIILRQCPIWSHAYNTQPSSMHTSIRSSKISRLFSSTVTKETNTPSTTTTESFFATLSSFERLAYQSINLLIHSDFRRDAVSNQQGTNTDNISAGSSATNWIDEKSALKLVQTLEKVTLPIFTQPKDIQQNLILQQYLDLNFRQMTSSSFDSDSTQSWLRWMQGAPQPMILDLTTAFQKQAQLILAQNDALLRMASLLDYTNSTKMSWLQRLGCKIYVIPSGGELLDSPLEPTGSMIMGKLLYGGVTRYRLLPGSKQRRRVGEQTLIKSTWYEHTPVWIQYGGMERKYQALDMGPAAFLEIFVLPLGKDMSHTILSPRDNVSSTLVLNHVPWNVNQILFDLPILESDDNQNIMQSESSDLTTLTPMNSSGKQRNEAFVSDFTNTVGGLRPQINQIVRRVLDGRVIRPADEDGSPLLKNSTLPLQQVSLEAEELIALGLQPVRGLLLYGPPGCGKTALAREVSKALRARTPKIISAPELLDRWVGGSEKRIRELFADAEAEMTLCNGDATKSALHVIVIDEIDAVFRKRSAGEDSGEATRSSAVNQILAKLDGVKAIPNVLIIGMTNRRELLDEALLRPGRLEVQIFVPLPNKDGRREILQIHFNALRRRGRLSKQVIHAIDGSNTTGGDSEETSRQKIVMKETTRKLLRPWIRRLPSLLSSNIDLAADAVTGGFSGADLAGLVRCAGSHALARLRRNGEGVDSLLITMDDIKAALKEVKK